MQLEGRLWYKYGRARARFGTGGASSDAPPSAEPYSAFSFGRSMSAKSEAEKDAQIGRLQRALAAERDRQGAGVGDAGVAARLALARLRDNDFPEFAEAVYRTPKVRALKGYLTAEAYCRTHLRSLVDALVLQAPRTPELVQTLHRLHGMLSAGACDVLMRNDLAGERARIDFVEAVERYAYAPAIQAAFARSNESYPETHG